MFGIRRVSVINGSTRDSRFISTTFYTRQTMHIWPGYGSFSSLHPVASQKAERTWCRACRLCVFKRIRQLAKSPFCEENVPPPILCKALFVKYSKSILLQRKRMFPEKVAIPYFVIRDIYVIKEMEKIIMKHRK